MPPVSAIHTRLKNVTQCLTTAVGTLDSLSDTFGTPFLPVISATALSLVAVIEKIKRNKDDCANLLENIYQIISAIIELHLRSKPTGQLSPAMLYHIAKFTETLNKIHTFAEALQGGSRLKQFFRQNEMSQLLKDCKQSLQVSLDVFQINTSQDLFKDIESMQGAIQSQEQELLELISTLSDNCFSDGDSLVCEARVSPVLSDKTCNWQRWFKTSETAQTHWLCCLQSHRYFTDVAGSWSRLSMHFIKSNHESVQSWVQVVLGKLAWQELSFTIQMWQPNTDAGSLLDVNLEAYREG
ncbi:hypothetical protein B0H15DRAFT_929715 [Mycena belliarum]|uniref:Uncharacterized protein n=1 Tax=Mycena belliarum TaxID=1033014 RepID=A0AAD6XQX7_9AGAR|nr:hypothetical protein B0H15DRAFT_929715 [Mycena belliae]